MEPICCELYHASLEQPDPFEALSYCWGSADNRPVIRLNTCPHLVTKNLEAALRHLRSKDEPRTLWVDALCINQQSSEDKKAQVQIMDEIYRRSRNVISWLGEASHDSDEAMRTMGVLGRWMKDNESEIFDGPNEDEEHLTMNQFFEAKGFPMSKPTVKIDKSLGTLSCKGVLLGATRRVIGPYVQGQKPVDGTDFYQDVTSGFGNRQFFTEMCDFCRSLLQTDKNLLCRTLVMDHDSTTPGEDPSYPAPAEFVDTMQAAFEQRPVPNSLVYEGSLIDD